MVNAHLRFIVSVHHHWVFITFVIKKWRAIRQRNSNQKKKKSYDSIAAIHQHPDFRQYNRKDIEMVFHHIYCAVLCGNKKQNFIAQHSLWQIEINNLISKTSFITIFRFYSSLELPFLSVLLKILILCPKRKPIYQCCFTKSSASLFNFYLLDKMKWCKCIHPSIWFVSWRVWYTILFQPFRHHLNGLLIIISYFFHINSLTFVHPVDIRFAMLLLLFFVMNAKMCNWTWVNLFGAACVLLILSIQCALA